MTHCQPLRHNNAPEGSGHYRLASRASRRIERQAASISGVSAHCSIGLPRQCFRTHALIVSTLSTSCGVGSTRKRRTGTMAQLKPITNRMRGEAPSAVQRHIGAERTALKVIGTSPRGYAMIFRFATSNCQPRAPAATLLLRCCRQPTDAPAPIGMTGTIGLFAPSSRQKNFCAYDRTGHGGVLG